MYTIVGSGFGLYGYLPALVEQLREQVVLPSDYRERFARRAELARYASAIHWAADREAALDAATGLVVATTPQLAPDAVKRAGQRARIVNLILEKPIAATPELALQTLADASGKRVRVGFILLHTNWHAAFIAATRGGEGITIVWHFLAHHFRHGMSTWKRRQSEGGGVLRFYGIHLIALLADAGYDVVEQSSLEFGAADEPERWQAAFSGRGRPICTIDVDSRSTSLRFAIAAHSERGQTEIFDDRDPFARESAPAGQDVRVATVAGVIATLAQPDERWKRLYADTHTLWLRVEALSRVATNTMTEDGHDPAR